jgi:hypothetical protein
MRTSLKNRSNLLWFKTPKASFQWSALNFWENQDKEYALCIKIPRCFSAVIIKPNAVQQLWQPGYWAHKWNPIQGLQGLEIDSIMIDHFSRIDWNRMV